MKKEMIRNTILTTLLIGIVYSWVGTGYLCWIYRLLDRLPEETVDLFANIIDYFVQALGIVAFSIFTKICCKRNLFNLKVSFTISIVCELISMIIAITVSTVQLSVIFGISMDFFCGVIFACSLMYLTALERFKAITIGIGWSIGTLSSWLVSIPMDGEFLKSDFSLVLYGLLAVISLLIIHFPLNDAGDKINSVKEKPSKIPAKIIVLSMLTITFIETTRSLGFMFPISDFTSGSVNIEYSRAFSVVGLIIAGIVCDRSRQGGLLLCVATLICPFISLLFNNFSIGNIVVWALNYAITGFITVYSITLFSDYAQDAVFLAGFGTLCRRIGESGGTLLGTPLLDYPVILIILISVFFLTSVICAVLLWWNVYLPGIMIKNNTSPDTVNEEEKLRAFANANNLSSREIEVLQEVIKGGSNSKIAEALFISENTVKFHMKNILKKTGVPNRTELSKMFNEHKNNEGL